MQRATSRVRVVVTVGGHVVLDELDVSTGSSVMEQTLDVGPPVTNSQDEMAGVDEVEMILWHSVSQDIAGGVELGVTNGREGPFTLGIILELLVFKRQQARVGEYLTISN